MTTLDLKGLQCPLPVLRANKTLRGMAGRRGSVHPRDRRGGAGGFRRLLPLPHGISSSRGKKQKYPK